MPRFLVWQSKLLLDHYENTWYIHLRACSPVNWSDVSRTGCSLWIILQQRLSLHRECIFVRNRMALSDSSRNSLWHTCVLFTYDPHRIHTACKTLQTDAGLVSDLLLP